MYLSSMRRLRRFATLLFLPLSVQLMLAAKAVACVAQRSDISVSQASMSSMPGMQMPDASKSTHDSHSPNPKRFPCNRPFGGGDCQPLAACASGALAASCQRISAVDVRQHTVLALVVLAPASRTTPPELPPPRA